MSIEIPGFATQQEQVHSNGEDASDFVPVSPTHILSSELRGRDRLIKFQSRPVLLAPPDMCREGEFKMRDPDFANVRQALGIVGNNIRAGLRYFLDKALLDPPAFNIEDFRPAIGWLPRGIAALLFPSKHD